MFLITDNLSIARIEFKEESNPFGSPETTLSLIGYNLQDIEILQETLSNKLDAQVCIIL